MFEFPPPPPLSFPPLATWGVAAGVLLIGVVLVLSGRRVARLAAALVGVGIGVLLAGPLAGAMGIRFLWAALLLAVVLGLLAIVLARLIWALTAAGLLVAGVLLIMLKVVYADMPESWRPAFPEFESLAGWSVATGRFLLATLESLWELYAMPLVVIGALAALAALLMVLVRPRLGKIVLTATLGGGAIVVAVGIATGELAGDAAQWFWMNPWITGGIVALLTAVGVLLQYRGALADERESDDVEAEPPSKRHHETDASEAR